MALRARSSKRARSPAAKFASGDEHALAYLQPPDDEPRRKRATVSANLRFLEKMPPLRDYQRGRFGRRGGVDGGAPADGDSSLWMRALEESLEETSFVTREAPTCAALVAPAPAPAGSTRSRNYVPVPVAVSSTSPASSADADAARRRRLFALQAARGGGKDDEARPPTEGLLGARSFVR